MNPSHRASSSRSSRLFSPSNYPEERRVLALLRKETVGGILLVIGAALALIWANSPFADSYFELRDTEIGFEFLHLKLSLGAWAADGLLAIFFFLVGLELKREFVTGNLRTVRTAIVPVMAALGGVAVPAILYLIITSHSAGTAIGWAIPTATDIAFAVAVLALIGSHLPPALRVFLLTLAVVDDLVAISIIALFFTTEISWLWLTLACIPFAAYGYLTHRFRSYFERARAAAWWILLPIGVSAWALVHASGIHATIAGVVLGFLVPVRATRKSEPQAADKPGLAEQFEHRFRPLSAGFAVPVFAFFSAGVAIGGVEGFLSAVTSTVGLAIIIALVLGKPLGIVTTTWLATKFTQASLDRDIRWIDLLGVGILAGIGFTVSLLVTELSFGTDTAFGSIAKVAILTASVLASVLASGILLARNRRYKVIGAALTRDDDGDGIPDAYQTSSDR